MGYSTHQLQALAQVGIVGGVFTYSDETSESGADADRAHAGQGYTALLRVVSLLNLDPLNFIIVVTLL